MPVGSEACQGVAELGLLPTKAVVEHLERADATRLLWYDRAERPPVAGRVGPAWGRGAERRPLAGGRRSEDRARSATQRVVGVVIREADDVLEIALDRPERKNALTSWPLPGPSMPRRHPAIDGSCLAILLRRTGDDLCTGADGVATNTTGTVSDHAPVASSVECPLLAHRLTQVVKEVQLPVVCAHAVPMTAGRGAGDGRMRLSAGPNRAWRIP